MPRLPHRRRPAPTALLMCALLPLLALAGCGASASARASEAATPSATPTPTRAPMPTLAPGQITGPCASDPHNTGPYYPLGDLVVSPVALALAYPSQQLPAGTPLAPVKLTTDDLGHEFPASPPVNPRLQEPGAGYAFSVCNNSTSRSHVLRSVGVTIESFTPSTAQLSAWAPCDGFYARPGPATFGGCGGSFAADEYLHATFAASGVGPGSFVEAAQTGTGNAQEPGTGAKAPPLPVNIAPGKSIEVNVGVTPPTAPGTYGFGFTIVVDSVDPGAAPGQFSTMVVEAEPILLAPVAHKWSGKGCERPAMLAQIPPEATNPPTMYVCPES
jgi:hypothetical protein